MDLYDRVKLLAKERNITIETLCQEINLSLSTYSGTRNRKQYLDLRHLIKIADYFGVSLDYLAYGYDKIFDSAEIKSDIDQAISILQHAKNNL